MSLSITLVEQNTPPNEENELAVSSWQLDSDVEEVPPSPISRSIELREDHNTPAVRIHDSPAIANTERVTESDRPDFFGEEYMQKSNIRTGEYVEEPSDHINVKRITGVQLPPFYEDKHWAADLHNYLQAMGQHNSLYWKDSIAGLKHSPTWTATCYGSSS